MKKKILFLILLFILFGTFMGVRYLFLANSTKDGRIQIMSSPHSNVVIDDKAVGKTPFETALPEGEHFIKLIADDSDASASASWEGKVTIFKNTRTFVSREIGINDLTSSGVIMTVTKITDKSEKGDAGRIEVQTEPDGSIVFLDDEEQGIAPLILSNIPKGDHELSVFSPGFFRRSQKVKVQSGYSIIAHYKLAIDPSHKKVEKLDSVATPEAGLTTTPGLTVTVTPSVTGAISGKLSVTVKETDTGFLRVRAEPTVNASESARVKPGETFAVIEEKSGWYKIEYLKGKVGWISAQYASKAQ